MTYFKRHFTPEFCQELLDQNPGVTLLDLSRQLAPLCASERYSGRPVAPRTVEEWIFDAIHGPNEREVERRENPVTGIELTKPDMPDRVNKIDELLRHFNIPLNALGAIESATVGSHDGFYKGQDVNGEPVAVRVPHLVNAKIKLVPPNPDFPVLQPAPTTTVVWNTPPRILRKTKSVVIVSDVQAGFLRDQRTDKLEPIHDPLSIEVAMQITESVQPEELDFIGDLTDLAMFSRWSQHPEYRGTLQPAINITHAICGGFVVAAGPRCKKRVVVGSNHDHRIEKAVLDWNKEALGVRRAGQIDGWPVFSLGYLARFDDLGLEWSGQFPGGEHYILDDLVIMHAPPKSKEFQASVIHGHEHKLRRNPVVQHSRHGRQVMYVADTGCLCRTGVTDDRFRLVVTNTPSDRGRTDWVQGISVVNIVEDKFPLHSIDLIEIASTGADERVAIYGGQVFRSRPEEALAA